MGITYNVVLFLVVFVESTSSDKQMVHVSCQEHLQYPHNDYCCLSCPAGQYVQTPCTAHLESGICVDCPHDSYTESDNGLTTCLQCTKCRFDQDMIRPCSSTQDTECQCKPGTFCGLYQVCEICRKCSICKPEEMIVRNCTSTSNTVCQKMSSLSAVTVAVLSFIALLFTVALVIVICWKKGFCTKEEEIPYKTTEILKINTVDVQDEDETPVFKPGPLAGSVQYRRLIPLNGQESLKRSLDLFAELDISYSNRFFRRIGLNDNMIQNADNLHHADKVYELLRIWIEKEGLKADINQLTEALLSLDQKLTAEMVIDKAVKNGDFVYADL